MGILDPEIQAVLDGKSQGCIICGDSLEVMKDMLGGCVDAVVTDPPWGLGDLSGTTSRERNRNAYRGYEDTEASVVRVVVPVVQRALILAGGRGLITPGVRCMYFYPRPRNVGGFYQPAAVGMSPWGFAAFNPVLFYGKDPRDGKGQSATMTTLTERASTSAHPCAKPLSAAMWLVEKATLEGESILDPFCGSGTTCIAAKKLGRRWIGIEIDPKYAEIARKRVEQTPVPIIQQAQRKDEKPGMLFDLVSARKGKGR